MLTFSSYKNTRYESSNLSGVDDFIQKIPDNTNNLITPRNLRDAIYTTWINNVFKQTTASGSYYIGLDSDSASSILTNPFYFGKRNYLGSNVMNSTLLNNGTDVFFFNNKPDTVTQSTIVTFLAGNPTLFNTAPYIITAATNSGLDISVINPNGNVNLTAASNSSIYLNGYKFPSISSTGSVGQALILGSNNIVSWQNVSSNFAYNNPKISTSAVGGIPSGISFSNRSVSDMFDQMFYPNIAPIMYAFSITYTGVSGTHTPGNFYTRSSVGSSTPIEIGSLTGSITYSVTIQPKSSPVTYATFSGSGTDGGYIQSQVVGGITDILTLSGTVLPVPNPNTASYTYNVYVKDSLGALSNTLSTNIQSYYPYYYYRSTTLYTANQIASWVSVGGTVSKVVTNTNSTISVNPGFVNPNNEYLYLVSPRSLSTWSNPLLSSDTADMVGERGTYYLTSISITPTSNYWIKTYYIYISRTPITKSNVGSGYNYN
jgi:hypothetical protein